MTDDHHGRMARRAILLVRAMDEILGTYTAITAIAKTITRDGRAFVAGRLAS
jgi:hypothetical protein